MTSLLGKSVKTVRNLTTDPPDYAGRPGSFAFASGTGTGTPSEAQLAAYSQIGTLFSVVSRLATATSKVEWKLWRKTPSGLDDDRTEVQVHPALNVWSRPNNFYTRNRFVETVQQHCDLTGEQCWVLVRDARLASLGPLEIWPVRPDRLAPVPSRDAFIAGYVYTSPSGEKVPLEVTDVIRVLMPNPLDPYRGLGPVQALMIELDSARYTAEWNRNFFLNSAQPGGVIEVPNDLSDPEFESMTTRWREQHKGVNAAHRVAVLEAGAKWVPNTFTQRDMQFVELRQVSRDAIREAYGIPKFALGDSDDVNRAVGEAMNAFFAEHLTEPRLDRVKEALNFQFLPMFYPGGWRTVDVEFDYVSPVPPDLDREAATRAASVAAATALIDRGTDPTATFEAFGLPALPMATVAAAPEAAAAAGPTSSEEARAQAEIIQKLYLGVDVVITLDEARALLARAGMPIDPERPMPEPAAPEVPDPSEGSDGGDETPAGDGSGDGPGDSAPGSTASGTAQPVDARRPDRQSRMINSARLPATLERPMVVPVSGARRPLNTWEIRAAVDVDGVQTDWTRLLNRLLTDWSSITQVQRDGLADHIRAAVNSGDVAALAALGVSSSEAAGVLLDALTEMSVSAADRVVAEAAEQGISIEPAIPDVGALTVVATVTASLLGGSLVNSAAREALRWLGYGRDGDQVSKAVTDHLAGLSEAFNRANLGHALTRAQNMARVATFEQAPKARWFASEVLDGSTCKPCSRVDGLELPTIDAMILAYGGGPYLHCLGTIRCRGLAIGVWES